MTMARTRLVDVSVTRWYHCITRCVRQAFLLGPDDGNFDRKQWIDHRLKELGEIFAISIGGRGGQRRGVIQDEGISPPEKLRKRVDSVVREGVTRRIDHEQSLSFAARSRSAGGFHD